MTTMRHDGERGGPSAPSALVMGTRPGSALYGPFSPPRHAAHDCGRPEPHNIAECWRIAPEERSQR